MVYNMQPRYRNTLRETYAGDQYDASGRQRGTPIPGTLYGIYRGYQWDPNGRQRAISTH